MAIPVDKLDQIMQVCEEWLDKQVCTKNQLQSLLGLLLYVSKCVKPARYFLNRMLQLLRDNFDKNTIKVTSDFTKYLIWFKNFLASYNGVTFYDIRPLQDQIHLDACLTVLGGAFNNMVYFIPIPKRLSGLQYCTPGNDQCGGNPQSLGPVLGQQTNQNSL